MLGLVSVTPPYAFSDDAVDVPPPTPPTALEIPEGIFRFICFNFCFVSAFKRASHFSDLWIVWDLFFFFSFLSVLGLESSLLPHSERVFEVSVLSTNASYLPSSE